MKYIKFKTFFFTILTLVFSSVIIKGQAKIDPLQIQTSTIFEDILKTKSVNPKITAADLAEQANTLLQKKGINFVFAFDQNVCQKILTAQQNRKDKSQPVKLNAKLKSVDAEDAVIALPDISFNKSECGKCFVQLPVFEFAGKDFITSVQGTNIKFFTPSDFIFNEVFLFDKKNPLSANSSMVYSLSCVPLGISDDDKLLFLELPYKELNDLALVVFDGGQFQLIITKSELDLTAKTIKTY